MSAPPTFDIHLFEDFFRNVDEVLADIGSTASAGMIEYIVPIAWTSLCILGLVWALAIWNGQGSSVKDWFTKLAKFVFILQFASVFYGPWVAEPLMKIPDELSHAVSKVKGASADAAAPFSSTSAADQLVGGLQEMVMGTLQASVEAFKDWNVGGAVALFCAVVLMLIAGVLLLVAVIFNMLYAKIGMFYILAVGPLFIFFLALPGVRNWFYGWLNTAFYFVILSVFSTLSMLLFTGIANKFMQKLAGAVTAAHQAQVGLTEAWFSMLVLSMSGKAAEGVNNAGGAVVDFGAAQMNVVSIALQMVLMFIPMFLVALETRTLVGSLTGGSGGSFGNGVVNVLSTMWRGGVGRAGGGGGGGGGGGDKGAPGDGDKAKA